MILPRPLRAEGYLAAFSGITTTSPADVTVEQSGTPAGRFVFHQVPFSGKSFQSPLYYGYRAGFFFTRHFGLEAEFVHHKIYANLDHPVDIDSTIGGTAIHERAPTRRYVQQFEVTHGLNMVLVNAAGRWPLVGGPDPRRARLVLTVRAGAGPTIPRPEVTILGVAGGGYQSGPIAVQGAGGIELRLWRGVAALAEYKYTFTPTSFDVPGGSAALHVRSNHYIFGVAVHF